MNTPRPHSTPLAPIRSMGPGHRERMFRHLVALSPEDRYLRFGYAANDAHIRRYIDGINLETDDVFGIFNRRLELLAMAHLAYAPTSDCAHCAEFGVSVLAHARGRSYGKRMFERAVMHARNHRAIAPKLIAVGFPGLSPCSRYPSQRGGAWFGCWPSGGWSRA